MQKFLAIVKTNFGYFVSLFLVLASIRIIEFFSVNYIGEEAGKISYLLIGFLIDFLLSTIVFAASIFVQRLLLIVNIKRNFVLPFISFLLITLTFSLFIYFKRANLPLDETVYLFTWDEIIMIGNFGENVSFATVILYLVLIFSYFFISKRLNTVNWNFKLLQITSVLLVLGLFLSPFVYFVSDNKSESVFVNNRLLYFVGKSYYHFKEVGEFKVFDEIVSAEDFKDLDKNFLNQPNLDQDFPLLHKLSSESEFATYFNKKTEQAPNIVFLIVESLSSDFIGKHAPETGNFMPFLDSLAQKSLYFPNFLSTCQRTFNVLPASLSSIPNSTSGKLTTTEKFTPQMSLPMLLDKAYFSRFYCGVDLSYTNMDKYVSNLNVDYLVENWSPKYARKFSKRPNNWGYPDGFLYEKSWEDYEKQNLAKKPRLDVFLTISSHDPFSFPEDEKYVKKLRRKLKSTKISKEIKEQLFKNEYVMASFAYTDDALRSYFQKARKMPDFDNTIFVIYGDHGCPFYARNQLSKFNVPLVIYSPLLKTNKTIYSVSSQLDLAPTLINFLRTTYNLDLPQDVSFLGRELDLTQQFRSKRNLSLLSANGVNESVLMQGKILLNGQLYQINKNFDLKEIESENLKGTFKNQLKFYEKFSKYCFVNQKIVPQKLYAQYDLKKINHSLNYMYLCTKMQTFSGNSVDAKEIKMGDSFSLNPKTKMLKLICDVDCFVAKESDIKQIPRMILMVEKKAKKSNVPVCRKVAFAYHVEEFKPNAFNKVRFEIELDLSKYKTLSKENVLRFYIDNLDAKSLKLRNAKSVFYSL